MESWTLEAIDLAVCADPPSVLSFLDQRKPFCRGLFAESKGCEVLKSDEGYVCHVPLGVVSDAKDVYDKSVSDTSTYGSQKSLAFSVAWIREVLRKDRTKLHWTSTENMLIDCGAKEMNPVT